MALSDEDAKRLTRAMVQALQQSRSVSDSEHYAHHTYIRQRIEIDRVRAEFWKKLLEDVAHKSIIGLLVLAATAIVIGSYFMFVAFKAKYGL